MSLKWTDTLDIAIELDEKYPDVDVLATEEIALKYQGADSSGISNEEITAHMNEVVSDVADNTIADRVGDSAAMAGLVASGLEAIEVLSGRKAVSDAGIDTLKTAGVAATSTALVAYLFS